MAIAEGVLSEDNFLISEILFNPNSTKQLALIQEQLSELQEIVKSKDYDRMLAYLNQARENIK